MLLTPDVKLRAVLLSEIDAHMARLPSVLGDRLRDAFMTGDGAHSLGALTAMTGLTRRSLDRRIARRLRLGQTTAGRVAHRGWLQSDYDVQGTARKDRARARLHDAGDGCAVRGDDRDVVQRATGGADGGRGSGGADRATIDGAGGVTGHRAHRRQSLGAQDQRRHGVARDASTRHDALHADLQLVVESNRALVRQD
jgi:hypothetical protein